MEHLKKWLNLAVMASMVVSILGAASRTAAQADEPHSQPRGEAWDDYGNLVARDGLRFNYAPGPDGRFYRITLDHNNNVLSRQLLPASPYEASKRRNPPALPSAPSADSSGSIANGVSMYEEWRYGMFGNSMGFSNIPLMDLDNDGHLEMVMAGVSAAGTGWYIVRQTGPDAYSQVWLSDPFPGGLEYIEAADVDSDNIGEIFLGYYDGHIEVYDGKTHKMVGSFHTSTILMDLALGDVDHDGVIEVITGDNIGINVFNSINYQYEWGSTACAGFELEVGNVDSDAALEIVTGDGFVLDGISHQVQWDRSATGIFGYPVALGDLDGDGKDEIVGAGSWQKISIFDADTQVLKLDVTTALDVDAVLVTDVDLDGTRELVYGDGQWGRIHSLDGHTYEEEWYVDNWDHGVSDIVVGDVNNDGTAEVIWGAGITSGGPDHLFVADTVSHLIEWQSDDLVGPLSAVAAGDVDDDGQVEIVMASSESEGGDNDGIIHIFNGSTHALEWKSTDLPNIDTDFGIRSILIADVDDDGDTEFVIGTSHVSYRVFQVYNGKTHTLERQSTPNSDGMSINAMAVGDVDSDGHTEIVVGKDRAYGYGTGVAVLVFDGATAVQEGTAMDVNATWDGVYDIELADIDADAHVEIIASVGGVKIEVFDGQTHALEWSADDATYALDTVDIDSDGHMEIIAGTSQGVIHVYQGDTHALERTVMVGSSAIDGLLLTDVNADARLEFLLADDNRIYVYDQQLNRLLWRSVQLGGSGYAWLNHLSVADVDADLNPEVVLGSAYALYQFKSVNGNAGHQEVLPLVNRPQPGLYGRVTFNGAPAEGEDINLYQEDGGTFYNIGFTTTDSQGRYFFDYSLLTPGRAYIAAYINPSSSYNGRLYYWFTSDLKSYRAESIFTFNTFDIADVQLVAPGPGSGVDLPATFRWNRRSGVPSDSYQVYLFDPYGDAYYRSPLLGFVGTYVMRTLPSGLDPYTYYGWTVVVNSPDGGEGLPFYYIPVYFTGRGSASPSMFAGGLHKNSMDLYRYPGLERLP